MIQKIKDLMAVKEQIDIIRNNINHTSNSVDSLKTEVEALKQQINSNISDINGKHSELFKNFGEDINIIKEIRHEFEKELFQFQLLKTQLQKKMMEKFEEELGKELKIQMETLKTDSESYSNLKENVTKVSEKINTLSEEINKFIMISGNIKKEDFELTRFANKLQESDREKLDLMQKIDALERLVSKIRRQEYITR